MPTEKEKMLAGDWYDAFDPVLVTERRRARALLRAYNASSEGEPELRTRLLGDLLGSAGKGVWLEPPFFCDYGYNIHLEDGAYFNFNCVILDQVPVRVGARTLFGPGVHIYTVGHPLNAAERATNAERARPVEFGSDVWVGGGSIILPGVRVGARSVIGAGSVVTRDIPEGVLAVGNPCRVVRSVE